MSQVNGGIDESISHGVISHGTIYNAFGRQSPSPPPPTDQYFWQDDDGKNWITDDDDFFISTQPI